MKALRFAWDHPGLTAMGAVAAVLFAGAAIQSPWLLAVYIVAALSLRRGLKDAARIEELERRCADERLRVQRKIWEAQKAATQPYVAADPR